MTTHVFIPTRARAHLIRKTLPHWLGQEDTAIHLVVDPTIDAADYAEFDLSEDIELLYLPDVKMGMGRIRQFILEIASARDIEAYVQADDDSYPAKGHVRDLVDTVIEEEVVGCGASNSYHGLMIGNEVLKMNTRFPIAGGYGHIMFGINTQLAFEVGGYPEWATAWGEDTELQRQGISEGMMWWYSTHVQMGSVAKRYSPGGLAKQYPGSQREKQERECHQKIYDLWPDYISKPETGRFRCAWKRMCNDLCPGWESDVPKRVRRALAAR